MCELTKLVRAVGSGCAAERRDAADGPFGVVNDDPSIFDGVGSMGMYSARTGLDVGPHWRDHVHFPSHAPSLPSASRQIRQAFVGAREIQRIELLLDDELPAVVFVDHTGAINTALDPTDTSPATCSLATTPAPAVVVVVVVVVVVCQRAGRATASRSSPWRR